jgi:hypothetical protein
MLNTSADRAGIATVEINPADLADLIGAPLLDPIATRVVHPSRATLVRGYEAALSRYVAATDPDERLVHLVDARDAGRALDAYGHVFDADVVIDRVNARAGIA